MLNYKDKKMRKIYKISVVLTVLLFTTSCKKYLDINSNPAIPQVVKAELLLPPIVFQMCNGTEQDYTRAVSKVIQNAAGASTANAAIIWEEHGFPAASDVGGVTWRMVYADLGLNLENLIKDAVTNKKYEYAGIGYAIKAWAYQQCTDLYGPIILDEAFTVGQLQFHYQDQPDVYAKVHVWGDLALKYLNMTSPGDYTSSLQGANGDYIYKGDKDKWKKFVYALYALQYGHLVNKADYITKYADSVVKYVDLSFANESEDATIGFTATSAADANPMGPLNAGTSNSGWVTTSLYYGKQTTTILGLLTGGVRGTPITSPTTSEDPRLSRFLVSGTTSNTTDPVYTAVEPTHGNNTTTVPYVLGYVPKGSTTYTGKYIFTDKARYPLMTYSQLQFAKAEALFKKGRTGDAYTAYIAGIRATVDFYNQYGRTAATPDPVISEAEIVAYLSSDEVAKSGADLTIADIMQQKYIAQWGWGGMETWCDLRKYHYDPAVFRTYVLPPALTVSTQNEGKLAYRFRPRYNSEYVWNSAELDKWGGLATDYMTKETWFSQP